jgi:acyl-CoA thioesterase-1
MSTLASSQPVFARVALCGILAWCTQSRGEPPNRAGLSRAPSPVYRVPSTAGGATALPPGPLVSRSRPVVGWSSPMFPALQNIDDGDYSTPWRAGHPSPEHPAWVAIDVGAGPRRLLVNWSASGSYNYEETDYGSPGAYRLETSADSTDGVDGSWRTAVDVLAVSTHGQAHSVDFTGQRWLKLVVTGTPAQSPNGVQITEMDVHDVTAGATDTWFFAGDSITALAFNRAPAHQPSFAAWVHERFPAYFPAMIDGGTGGNKSDEGADHIDDWLARNPDVHFWAIQYGTNDSAGDSTDTTRYRANMQRIVDHVLAAGRVPILATIPFASDGQHGHVPDFNRVIDELRSARSLAAGPDLYSWFAAHPDELRDGVHPNDRGAVSMNRLWGEAVSALYSR